MKCQFCEFEIRDGLYKCPKCDMFPIKSEIINLLTEYEKENILQEAQRITHSDRNKDYDDPIRNYEHIAKIASAILKKEVTPQDVIMIMIATKLSREQFKHKRDNVVDLCGYAFILGYLNGEEF